MIMVGVPKVFREPQRYLLGRGLAQLAFDGIRDACRGHWGNSGGPGAPHRLPPPGWLACPRPGSQAAAYRRSQTYGGHLMRPLPPPPMFVTANFQQSRARWPGLEPQGTGPRAPGHIRGHQKKKSKNNSPKLPGRNLPTPSRAPPGAETCSPIVVPSGRILVRLV